MHLQSKSLLLTKMFKFKKMKKFLIFFSFVVTTLLTHSSVSAQEGCPPCEQYQMHFTSNVTSLDASSDELKELLHQEEVTNALEVRHLQLPQEVQVEQLTEDKGGIVYSISLNGSSAPIEGVQSIMLVTSINGKLTPLITEFKRNEGTVEGIILYDLLHSEKLGAYGTDLQLPGIQAARVWQNFKDCMISSWNSMTSDFWGIVACGLHPQLCLATATLYCAIKA